MVHGAPWSARARRRRALLFLALFFLAVVLLRPWLNEGDDLRFWAASVVLIALGATAIVESLRGIRR